MQAMIEFLIPKRCISCMDRLFTPYLICEDCLLGVEFLDHRASFPIEKFAPYFVRVAAPFGQESPMSTLLSDVRCHAKVIAAWFYVYLRLLPWPPMDALYAPHPFQRVGKYLSSYLSIPLASRGISRGRHNILMITPRLLTTLPGNRYLGQNLFQLGFLSQHNTHPSDQHLLASRSRFMDV